MSEEKRATLLFETEKEATAFKLGLFWNPAVISPDGITSMRLPTGEWRIEIFEIPED